MLAKSNMDEVWLKPLKIRLFVRKIQSSASMEKFELNWGVFDQHWWHLAKKVLAMIRKKWFLSFSIFEFIDVLTAFPLLTLWRSHCRNFYRIYLKFRTQVVFDCTIWHTEIQSSMLGSSSCKCKLKIRRDRFSRYEIRICENSNSKCRNV